MTDKVQKIREEVVRLQNELIQEREKGNGSDVDDACILELQNVLTYIDSLQEEPVSEEQVKESTKTQHITEMCKNSGDSLTQEPVSEELEEAALLYYPKMPRISEPHGVIPADNQSHYLGDANEDNRRAFIVGAKWKEKEMQSTIELAEDHAMFAGMEKMKEQMMKNAVGGYVIKDIEEGNGDFLLSADYLPVSMGLKDRQKVKVIILKDE